MKPRLYQTHRAILPGLITLSGLLATSVVIQAASVTKAPAGSDLANAGSWEGGAVPTAADTATWDASSLASGLTLPSGAVWLGVTTAASAPAAIDIAGAGTLTLGSGGINLSLSTTDLTLGNPIILGASQTWQGIVGSDIASTAGISGGATLTLDGAGNFGLGGSNSHSGGTILQGTGSLALGNSGALGSGGLTLQSSRTNSDETLILDGGITIPNTISINLTTGREGITGNTGNNTISGPVSITGTGANHVYFKNLAGAGTTFTLSGPITAPSMTEGLGFRGDAGNFGLVTGQVNITGFFEINGGATWTVSSTGNSWTQTRIQGAANGGFTLGADNALATTASLWFGNNTSGALDLAGFDQTVRGIDCASTTFIPVVGNSSTTEDSLLRINGGGFTFAGRLVDTLGGGTRKLAVTLLSGSQTLSGANTYTGATTISGGSLTVNGSLGAGSAVTVQSGARLMGTGTVAGPVSLQNGGSLTPADGIGAGTLTLGSLSTGNTAGDSQKINLVQGLSSIAVTGGLTQNGTTTINVAATNGIYSAGISNLITYTGTTVTNGFTLGLPPRAVANLIYDPGIIKLNLTSSGDTAKWTGAASGVWDTVAGNWKLAAADTPTTYIEGTPGDYVLFEDLAGGTSAVTLANTVTPAGVNFNNVITDYSLTGAGGIAGTTTLTKNGTGILTLGANNTFTGLTSVNSGTLNIQSSGALGSTAAGTAVANGAGIGLSGGVTVIGEPLSIRGGGFGNVGAFRNISGDNAWTGDITLTNSCRFTSDSGTLSLGNMIAGTRTVVMNGPGNVTVNGNITGTTGSIAVDNAFNTGTSSGTLTLKGVDTITGTITVSCGTLSLEGSRTATSGVITVGNGGSFPGILNVKNGNFSTSSAANIQVGQLSTGTVNHTAGTLQTALSGTGLVLIGSGAGMTGTYNLSGGALLARANSNNSFILGTNDGSVGEFNLSGTGSLTMNSGTSAIFQIGRCFSSPTVTTSSTGTFNQTGGTALFRNIAMGGGATNSGTVSKLILTGGAFSVNLAISSLSAGDNSSSEIIIGGTADVTLPEFPTTRGSGSTATITFNGGTLRPRAASATYMGGLTKAFVTANGANFDVATGNDITISQVFENAPSQAGRLTKSGAGKLTLTGLNTHSGSTVVNAGTLAVNGTAIPGKLVINGGKVEPTGTEIVSSLVFGTTQQAAGTYGATDSGAQFINDTYFSGTGKVSVTNGPGYASWAADYAPGQTADQDHDNDGVKNGLEYFMGATGSTFTANPSPVDGKVTWPKDPAFSGTYAIQTSSTMAAGSWTNVPVNGTNPKDNGTSVEYTLPAGQGKLFTRIQVTPN